MRHRKKEIQELITILDNPHDSVEDLAEEIWVKVDEFRRDREAWAVIVRQEQLIFLYGLYDTENSARKDLEKYRAVTENNRAMITKVLSPSALWGGELLDYK